MYQRFLGAISQQSRGTHGAPTFQGKQANNEPHKSQMTSEVSKQHTQPWSQQHSPRVSNQQDGFPKLDRLSDQNHQAPHAVRPHYVFKSCNSSWWRGWGWRWWRRSRLTDNGLKQGQHSGGGVGGEVEQALGVDSALLEVFLNHFLDHSCLFRFAHTSSKQHVACNSIQKKKKSWRW